MLKTISNMINQHMALKIIVNSPQMAPANRRWSMYYFKLNLKKTYLLKRQRNIIKISTMGGAHKCNATWAEREMFCWTPPPAKQKSWAKNWPATAGGPCRHLDLHLKTYILRKYTLLFNYSEMKQATKEWKSPFSSLKTTKFLTV